MYCRRPLAGFWFLCLLGTLWTGPVFALDVPKLTGPVVDLAGVLSQSDQKKIAASLLQFQRDYGPQLQVLVVPELEDETIESYSIKVVDKWKLHFTAMLFSMRLFNKTKRIFPAKLF